MNAGIDSISEDSGSSQSINKRSKVRTKIKHSDGLKTGELSGKMWRLGENEDRASRRKPVVDPLYHVQPKQQLILTKKKEEIKPEQKNENNVQSTATKPKDSKKRDSNKRITSSPSSKENEEHTKSLKRKREDPANKKEPVNKKENIDKEESLNEIESTSNIQVPPSKRKKTEPSAVTKKLPIIINQQQPKFQQTQPKNEKSPVRPKGLLLDVSVDPSSSAILGDEVVVAQLAGPSNRKSQFAVKKPLSENDISLIEGNKEQRISNICSNCNKISVWSNAKFCGFCGTLI